MREYLLTLTVAAAASFLLTPLARRFAVRVGAMTEVRDRDVHAIPTPRLGGLALLLGFGAALLVASKLPLLQQVFTTSYDPVALLAGAAVITGVGMADDLWGLDAVTKLAGQVLAAGVMVLFGVQLLWLPIPLPAVGTLSLGPEAGVVLTVAVVVLTINAVNFVDGLDGLAAGIVGIAAVAFFSYSYLLTVEKNIARAATATLVTAALTGLCLGFLPHNFNPARVFMGDSGSMLIGLLLAGATVSMTGQVDPGAVNATDVIPTLLPLVLPVAVLAVPLADLVLAVVRRTRAGRAPWAPDKQHLHHRLLEIGHSHARAVVIMYLWSAIIAFGAVTASFVRGALPLVGAVGAALLLGAVTVALPRLGRARRLRRLP